MTQDEIIDLFEELHGAGLANAPKDATAAVKLWRDFFGGDDARVIGKAVWIHMKNSKFWPTPNDIERVKQKASWLVEMEGWKLLEERQKLLQPPTAPKIDIRESAETFCDICGLCDEKDQDKCPFDF